MVCCQGSDGNACAYRFVKEKKMKSNNDNLRQLTFLAICIALSLVTKRIVSPVTNILTDFIRIPGGGAATAFSIMFLLVGCSAMSWRWAGSYAGFVQSLIALSLGMSSYQGLFALLTYTVPGIVIDLFRMLYPKKDNSYFALACAAANTAGALLSNLLVFKLQELAFLLWMLVACSFGLGGGMLGSALFSRIKNIPEYRRNLLCQKN